METINPEFAYNLGRQFAAELNADPKEAQNWGPLTWKDGLPDGDYSALTKHYGDSVDDRIVQAAYIAGFNAVFVPLQRI